MEVVERARKNYKNDVAYWSSIYEKAKEDLFFLSDDEFAQWNAQEAKQRVDTGRPVLTVDQLSQFIHRVANNIRQNTPSIRIIPSHNGSTEVAEIYMDIIRNIEYISSADTVYDTASLSAIKCSIGFIKIDHDYINNYSFEQELKIKRIVNPLAIIIDGNSVEVDGSDARWGYIIDKITVKEFERKYPGKQVSCFESENEQVLSNRSNEDKVTICEYYEIVEENKEIGLLSDNSIEDVRDGIAYLSTRKINTPIVKKYTLSGKEVLEETVFPGRYIPIVPVYGEEAWIEGERNIFSLIRKSKDAQRMFNYWKSTEADILLRQTKAYVMVAEGQIEEYLEDWTNPDKAIALTYKTTDLKGNPCAAPQMLNPPQIPTGIVNASQGAIEDIKSTMGIYNAALGQVSNETSGVAIMRRKEEGDVATYHFPDNLSKSIAQVGRILTAAIPQVYDTPRIIRIIGKDDKPKQIGINGLRVEGQEEDYDLSQGQYDVKSVTGISYMTRRQETSDFLTNVVAQNPQMLNVVGDILFENMDIAGAEALAERMKKIINPELLDEDKKTDPEKEQMKVALAENEQVIAVMQQKFMEIEQQLKDKQAELIIKAQSERNKNENDAIKNQIEERKAQIDAEKVINERIKIQNEYEYKMAELALKEEEIRRNSVVSEPMVNEYY